MGLLKEMMFPLETKHEKWMVYNDEVFRYRDAGSIEGKPMMEGPEGRAVEDWFGYFYNCLMEYKAYMEKELGIAAKGGYWGGKRCKDFRKKQICRVYST